MQYLYQEAEKFIKDIYWAESHDKSNTLNISDVVGERLVQDNKEKDPEYYDHRPGVVHVSSLSKCLRGVVHEMLGTPKDEVDEKAEKRQLGVFKAGNLFEEFIVEAMGDKMLDRQTEYVYKYHELYVTGRDDGTISHDGGRRMLECKSVHSDSFWHREKEGTLCAYQNQMQIQTYLYFRRILPNVFVREDTNEIIYTNLDKQALWEYRGMKPDDVLKPVAKPDESNLNGIFAYISKDDCTIAQAPVKFNQRIIDETVLPALEAVRLGYVNKNPNQVEAPPLTTYQVGRGQHTKNWLCTYCSYHQSCAGKGWVLEAQAEVTRLNKEQAQGMANKFQEKPSKPTITATPVAKPAPVVAVDQGQPGGDKTVEVTVEDNTVTKVEVKEPTPAPEGETTLQKILRERKDSMGL